MSEEMIVGQTDPCSLCGGSAKVRDNIDPLDYPETAPCPKCGDGEWAYRALMNRLSAYKRLREALERLHAAAAVAKALIGREQGDHPTAAIRESNINQAWHALDEALSHTIPEKR